MVVEVEVVEVVLVEVVDVVVVDVVVVVVVGMMQVVKHWNPIRFLFLFVLKKAVRTLFSVTNSGALVPQYLTPLMLR